MIFDEFGNLDILRIYLKVHRLDWGRAVELSKFLFFYLEVILTRLSRPQRLWILLDEACYRCLLLGGTAWPLELETSRLLKCLLLLGGNLDTHPNLI